MTVAFKDAFVFLGWYLDILSYDERFVLLIGELNGNNKWSGGIRWMLFIALLSATYYAQIQQASERYEHPSDAYDYAVHVYQPL